MGLEPTAIFTREYCRFLCNLEASLSFRMNFMRPKGHEIYQLRGGNNIVKLDLIIMLPPLWLWVANPVLSVQSP